MTEVATGGLARSGAREGVDRPTVAPSAAIELDDVFVVHRGSVTDVVALRGLSLRASPGERVVVHGPSGAGKSTLVQVLCGSVVPAAGRVRIAGGPPTATAGMQTRSLGVISQGSGRDLAPELSCAENVALQARLFGYRRDEARDLAARALERFGIGHLARRSPMSLSNGEAQRIAVCGAIVAHPTVIVADEPTGELDPGNARAIYQLLDEQVRHTGATLLLVTHDPAAGEFSDRVLTIRDGRLSEARIGGREQLVVDPNGWVRLPAAARAAAGIGDRAQLSAVSGGAVIQLEGDGRVGRSPATATVDPAAAATPAAAAAPDACPPVSDVVIVHVKDATVVAGGVAVLGATTCSVRRGLTVITGPSGSGKTTLLGLLGGLAQASSGTVDHKAASIAIGTSLAGFMEDATLEANLALSLAARGSDPAHRWLTTAAFCAAVREVLAEVGLDGFANRPAMALSGGERQRAGVARTLLADAELMLMDEPTSQLDERTAERIAESLLRHATHRAIVCTTHDPALIARAHHVIELR